MRKRDLISHQIHYRLEYDFSKNGDGTYTICWMIIMEQDNDETILKEWLDKTNITDYTEAIEYAQDNFKSNQKRMENML